MKSWWTSSLYSRISSSIWRMQNIWSIVDLLHRNQHWWSPTVSSAYGVNLRSRMFDKNFVRSLQKWYSPIINTICFIALHIERYNNRLLSLFRQFLLISNRNNKLMHLITYYSKPCLNQFCWIMINTRWFVTFWLFNNELNLKGWGTSGFAVCISV